LQGKFGLNNNTSEELLEEEEGIEEENKRCRGKGNDRPFVAFQSWF
jgi:hypothetical protein